MSIKDPGSGKADQEMSLAWFLSSVWGFHVALLSTSCADLVTEDVQTIYSLQDGTLSDNEPDGIDTKIRRRRPNTRC